MMANNNAPFGLQAVGRYGTPFQGYANHYHVKSDYGTALYIGDPVLKTGTSNTASVIQPGYGSFNIATLRGDIGKAADGATDKITGVIVGFAPLVSDLSKTYNPANTERIALVCDDPMATFLIQADGAVNAVDIGMNANLIFTQAGSTATGQSGVELDTSSMISDATYQCTILGVLNSPSNTPALIRNVVIVRLNLHTEAYGVVGI